MGSYFSRQRPTKRSSSIRSHSQEIVNSMGTCHATENVHSDIASQAISDFVNNIPRTHELHVGSVPEGCLSKYRGCDKNPDHSGFTPIKKLVKEDLPDGALDKDLMFEWIKARSRLTVRIRGRIVSPDRPQSLLLPGMIPGEKMVTSGTGCVSYKAELLDPSQRGCDGATGNTYIIHIDTAAHVLFDDVEAAQAVVEFYFDDQEDTSTVVTAAGWKVDRNDIDGDFCYFMAITNNKVLVNMIERDWDRVDEIDKNIKQALDGKFPYYFTISHPHAFSQHVSFGDKLEEIHVDKDNPHDPYYYRYNIPTCPGSSGAQIVGAEFPDFPLAFFSQFRPHHGFDPATGLNRSGWWDTRKN